MSIFMSSESMQNEVVLKIIENPTIMKYLVYDDVLVDPSTLPNVENPSDYIYTPEKINTETSGRSRIYVLPKMPKIEETQKTYILSNIKKITPDTKKDIYFAKYMLTLDIVTHIDLWMIKGGIIRTLRIANEIFNMFSLDETDNSKGLIKFNVGDEVCYDSNELFWGYKLSFLLNGVGKSC